MFFSLVSGVLVNKDIVAKGKLPSFEILESFENNLQLIFIISQIASLSGGGGVGGCPISFSFDYFSVLIKGT